MISDAEALFVLELEKKNNEIKTEVITTANKKGGKVSIKIQKKYRSAVRAWGNARQDWPHLIG